MAIIIPVLHTDNYFHKLYYITANILTVSDPHSILVPKWMS